MQKNEKTKKLKESERTLKPWTKPEDACFIIEGQRVSFHYKGIIKDLCLKNDSKTHRLLFLLSNGSLQEADVKSELCKQKTKPSDVVDYSNKALNRSIAQKGFVGVPSNVEFIKHDKIYRHYACNLKIHLSKKNFDKILLEQSLVDDRQNED